MAAANQQIILSSGIGDRLITVYVGDTIVTVDVGDSTSGESAQRNS